MKVDVCAHGEFVQQSLMDMRSVLRVHSTHVDHHEAVWQIPHPVVVFRCVPFVLIQDNLALNENIQ